MCFSRKNNESLPEVNEVFPVATLGDGHWTNPYFDCGGGNVWMVTYSSPVFYLDNQTVRFRYVSFMVNETAETKQQNTFFSVFLRRTIFFPVNTHTINILILL